LPVILLNLGMTLSTALSSSAKGADMNHKERVRAVLNGETVDRIPVSTWGHDFLREWSAEELAAHTIERQRRFDYDFVKLNPRWTLFAEAFGNRYRKPVEQTFPKLEHRVINGPDDLDLIAAIKPDMSVFDEYVCALELVVEEIGDQVDVLATVFSPLACVGLLAGGVGKPLIGYAQANPSGMQAALQHVSPIVAQLAQRLLDHGAAGLFYAPLQWTSLSVCDAQFYSEYGEPHDLVVLESASSPFNILHVCGNNIGLERFYDFPVSVLNWDNFGEGNPSLLQAHGACDKIVSGGVPHLHLHKLAPDHLYEQARSAVKGVDDRLMLTGGCAVGAMISDDVRKLISAFPERFGQD
jgi:uroporphyrinogen decarboxylase